MMDVALALLHYPVLNKRGETIATAVVNLDIHDIARSCRTYGVRPFFVVNPAQKQRDLAEKILEHWTTGYGARYNPDRKQALQVVKIVPDWQAVVQSLASAYARLYIATTGARTNSDTTDYRELRRLMAAGDNRELLLLVFGTGWGLVHELYARAHFKLTPIQPSGMYNHLSVRSATAIVLDRLLAENRPEDMTSV